MFVSLLSVIISTTSPSMPPITGDHPFAFTERVPLVDDTREDYVRYRLEVPGSKVTAGQAEVLIPASSEEVLAVLRDFEGYKDFLPFFTYSKLQAVNPSFAELRLKAKILKGTVEIDAQVKAVESRLSDGADRIHLQYIRGNIERFDARFRVYSLGEDSTFVVFYLMIDPDLWFARNKTLSEYNWVNCGRAVRALREEVLKGQAEAQLPKPTQAN